MRIPLLAVAVVVAVLVGRPAPAQYLEVPSFPMTTPSGWLSVSADVAAGRDGTVLVVWDQSLEDALPPRPREVAIQHFTATGLALAPAVRMSVSPRVNDAAPRVVGDETGGYLLTWTGGHIGTDVTPMFQRLDASGEPVGQQIQVDVSTRNQSVAVSNAIVAIPGNEAIVWYDGGFGDGVLVRRFDRAGVPFFDPVSVGGMSGHPRMDAVPTSDGGFVVGFGASQSLARWFDAFALPRADVFQISNDSSFMALAADTAGDVLAAVGTRPRDALITNEIWLRRFTPDGTMLGPEMLVYSTAIQARLLPSVAFDANGNLIVTWTEYDADGTRFRARGFYADETPIGPAVTLQTQSGYPELPHTVRLVDGFRFLSSWPRYNTNGPAANVVTLCQPGASVCGDGVRDVLCEICDAGAANSDVLPDACRTDCRPARCGDGTVDGGEVCDDGNFADCDGCSRTCQTEVGLTCGDGVAFPSCGQHCDDGNSFDRDGCSALCALERIPGGGQPKTDCYAEWSADNRANEPYLDKTGAVNATQTCIDGDPRCDFDGGVTGSCTFRIALCVNNTDLAACTPGSRLSAWTIQAPSANKAARDPVAAAQRQALNSAILGSVVGPNALDLCSPKAEVPVPLRGEPGRYGARKLTLKTRATLYTGATDKDTLRLICLPAS